MRVTKLSTCMVIESPIAWKYVLCTHITYMYTFLAFNIVKSESVSINNVFAYSLNAAAAATELMDLVYWMIGMSRFKALHERRPSMWSLAQTEIKDLSLVRTKGATFFYKERASFTATWW